MAVKAPIIIFERDIEIKSGVNYVELVIGGLTGNYNISDRYIKAVYDRAGNAVWVNPEFKGKTSLIKTRFKGTQVLFSDLVTFTGTQPGSAHHETKKKVGVLLFDLKGEKPEIGFVFRDVVQVFDSSGELAWERPADYKYP